MTEATGLRTHAPAEIGAPAPGGAGAARVVHRYLPETGAGRKHAVLAWRLPGSRRVAGSAHSSQRSPAPVSNGSLTVFTPGAHLALGVR